MKIGKEHFEEWLANPVTEEVFRLLKSNAAEARQQWADKAWEAGIVDERVLIEHRARAEALLQVTALDFEAIEEFQDDERKQERN